MEAGNKIVVNEELVMGLLQNIVTFSDYIEEAATNIENATDHVSQTDWVGKDSDVAAQKIKTTVQDIKNQSNDIKGFAEAAQKAADGIVEVEKNANPQ